MHGEILDNAGKERLSFFSGGFNHALTKVDGGNNDTEGKKNGNSAGDDE